MTTTPAPNACDYCGHVGPRTYDADEDRMVCRDPHACGRWADSTVLHELPVSEALDALAPLAAEWSTASGVDLVACQVDTGMGEPVAAIFQPDAEEWLVLVTLDDSGETLTIGAYLDPATDDAEYDQIPAGPALAARITATVRPHTRAALAALAALTN